MPKSLSPDPKFFSLSALTAVLCVLVIANSVSAQPQFVENVSGSFASPWGIAVDVSGDRLFIHANGILNIITLSNGNTSTVGTASAQSMVTTGNFLYAATSNGGVRKYNYTGIEQIGRAHV